MKALQFRSRNKSLPAEHPDGGLFYLFPFDPERGLEYSDKMQEIRESSAKQGVKYKDAARWVAENVVERIENVVDIDSGDPIVVDDEIKLQILLQVSDREIEREVPELDAEYKPKLVDGKPVMARKMLPANEPYFLWAMAEAGLLMLRREEETKN